MIINNVKHQHKQKHLQTHTNILQVRHINVYGKLAGRKFNKSSLVSVHASKLCASATQRTPTLLRLLTVRLYLEPFKSYKLSKTIIKVTLMHYGCTLIIISHVSFGLSESLKL